MNENIVIVTAFFDIGRGELQNKTVQRSNEQYFQYFEHWARMKNMLFVYTSKEYAQKISDIRDKFGLKDRTQVIVIENIYDIEQDIFHRMKDISEMESFKSFRFYYNAMSNNANYDYVMLMKYYFVQDVAAKNIDAETIAWLDFGFDHGGKLYPNSEEFSYLWNYTFSEKIHIFAHQSPKNINSIDSLQLQKDCLMGAPVCVSKKLANVFWNLIKDAIKALIMLDCIDDDQQLLLMAYKVRPELFEIHISDWFLPLKQFGGEHLTTRTKIPKQQSIVQQIKNVLRYFRNPKIKDFLARTKKRCQAYYD